MRLLFVGLVFSVEILSPVGAVEGKTMSCIVIVSPERERECERERACILPTVICVCMGLHSPDADQARQIGYLLTQRVQQCGMAFNGSITRLVYDQKKR